MDSIHYNLLSHITFHVSRILIRAVRFICLIRDSDNTIHMSPRWGFDMGWVDFSIYMSPRWGYVVYWFVNCGYGIRSMLTTLSVIQIASPLFPRIEGLVGGDS